MCHLTLFPTSRQLRRLYLDTDGDLLHRSTAERIRHGAAFSRFEGSDLERRRGKYGQIRLSLACDMSRSPI